MVLQALPQHGTLQINGSNATAGNSITFVGGVAQQTLTYTPSADYSGSDSFTFKVQDDGLTANGGNDLAVNANTFSIQCGGRLDPPTTANTTNVNTAYENASGTATPSSYVFSQADFPFSDPHDPAPVATRSPASTSRPSTCRAAR